MRGLGDTFNYADATFTVTFIDQNGNTLPWASLSAVEQSQALSACAWTTIFAQPSGSSLIITVNGAGSANDVPAFTGILAGTPGSPAVLLNSPLQPGRGPISGPEWARASNVLNGVTPAPSNAGGVATASLPANFQASPSQIAAAAASYQAQAANGGTTTSATSGIPAWVWLAGAAGIVFLIYIMSSGGNRE